MVVARAPGASLLVGLALLEVACHDRALADDESFARCAAVTDLFEHESRESVLFADTRGDGVPEAWRVRRTSGREPERWTLVETTLRQQDGSYAAGGDRALFGWLLDFADFDGDGRDDPYTSSRDPSVECGEWVDWFRTGLDGAPESVARPLVPGCTESRGLTDVFGDGSMDVVIRGEVYGATYVQLVSEGRELVLSDSRDDAAAGAQAVIGSADELLVDRNPLLAPGQLHSLALVRADRPSTEIWRLAVPGARPLPERAATRMGDGFHIFVLVGAVEGALELQQLEIDDAGRLVERTTHALGVDVAYHLDLDGDGVDDLAWGVRDEPGLRVKFGATQGSFEEEQVFVDIPAVGELVDHDADGVIGVGFSTAVGGGETAIYSVAELGACE